MQFQDIINPKRSLSVSVLLLLLANLSCAQPKVQTAQPNPPVPQLAWKYETGG